MHRGRKFLEWGLDDMLFVWICQYPRSHVCAEWASNPLGMHSLVIEHKQGHL